MRKLDNKLLDESSRLEFEQSLSALLSGAALLVAVGVGGIATASIVAVFERCDNRCFLESFRSIDVQTITFYNRGYGWRGRLTKIIY